PRNEIRPVEIGREFTAIGDLAGNIDAHPVWQDQKILQRGAVIRVLIRNVGIVGVEPALLHEPAFIGAVPEEGEGAVPIKAGVLHAEDMPVGYIFGMHHAWSVVLFSPRRACRPRETARSMPSICDLVKALPSSLWRSPDLIFSIRSTIAAANARGSSAMAQLPGI